MGSRREIEFLSFVLFVMKWTECTLNSAYHSVKDSWACPCYIAYLVVPTHLCLPLQMWQSAPYLTRQIPSEPYLTKKIIRWTTMRTWSPFRMQSLGWWDTYLHLTICCQSPTQQFGLACSTLGKLNLASWSNIMTGLKKGLATPQQSGASLWLDLHHRLQRWFTQCINLSSADEYRQFKYWSKLNHDILWVFDQSKYQHLNNLNIKEHFHLTGKWSQPLTLQSIMRSSRFRRRFSSSMR